MDPSVKGADYSVANILAESFPPEQVNEIYKAYAGAYATGQNIVNLSLVRELGPVVSALLFAGRAGTSLTAEIGLMKAGEQIAAMEMMAVDTKSRVLAPR